MELSGPSHLVEDELLEEEVEGVEGVGGVEGGEGVDDVEDEDNPLRIDEPSFPEITEGEEPLSEQMSLDRLPRPVHELNCRQARTYLVKLLRNANGGQNPHYGDPEMKPPFWPDYYWPWVKLTDVHTKPRGMNEPLQYSEMMKLAISRGYQYFGYNPSSYIDSAVEDLVKPCASSTFVPEPPPSLSNGQPPPKLIKPLSQLNCLHARTLLAKLLRYQQLGNNPVYGSPETRPPWWPDDCIRWVDMVDLRGRPPYLPDAKTYTDVLKIAIERAYKYYGYNPETHVADHPDNPEKLQEEDIDQIVDEHLKDASLSVDAPGAKHVKLMGAPPKLPIPVSKLNCGGARSCLSRLLRYRSGHQPPTYGNPQFMPSWWPNDIFEWSQIKNLSHRYEGYLGNSYSNCLRIAIIRGYAYYGYDANTYVEDLNGGSSAAYWTLGDPQNMTTTLNSSITSSTASSPTKSKKPMPSLLLIGNKDKDKEKDKEKNKETVNVPALLSNLQPVPLKVRFRRSQTHPLLNFLHQDYLHHKRFTDTVLVSSTGKRFKVHGVILRILSPKMKSILCELPADSIVNSWILLPDVSSQVLQLLIHALYTGEVTLESKALMAEVIKIKEFLGLYDLLQEFEISMLPATGKDDDPLVLVSDDEEETNFDLCESEKSAIHEDEMNFDDIIEAVATKIEEEEMAVVQSNDNGGIRRSFRTRRKKDMSDFELDSPTPPPVIKKEPIDVEEPVLTEETSLNEEISIKVEKPEEPTRRSARNISRKQQSDLKRPQNSPPAVQIPFKRYRPANKPRIGEVTLDKLERTYKTEGSKALTTLLMNKGFLCERPPKCLSCGDHATLVSDPSNEDGLVWRCSLKHKDIPVRCNSVFEDSTESLNWIMKIIICWSDNTSLNQCHQLFGADIDKIFYWYDKCKGYYGTL